METSMHHVRQLLVFYLATICLLCLPMLVQAQQNVKFYQGSIPALQHQAEIMQRPYILYFFTDWSKPCQQMDRFTYRSPGVIDFLNEYFLLYRVDVTNPDRGTVDLPNQYKVWLFPTLIVCDAKGNVIKELSGYVSPEKLIQELSGLGQPVVAAKPKQVAQTTPTITNATTAPIVSEPLVSESMYYVVQVGVFGDYQNVQREMNRLKAVYKQPVRVYSGELRGSQIHRVVVGPFAERRHATAFQQQFNQAEGRNSLLKQVKDFE